MLTNILETFSDIVFGRENVFKYNSKHDIKGINTLEALGS